MADLIDCAYAADAEVEAAMIKVDEANRALKEKKEHADSLWKEIRKSYPQSGIVVGVVV